MTSPTPAFSGDGWYGRRSTPEDNAEICRIFREVHMKSDLDLCEERDPDFFALLEAHGSPYQSWVICDENDQIQGCGSCVIRDAWVNGEVRKFGFMCDARVTEPFRKGRVFPAFLRAGVDNAHDEHGVELLYGAIIRSNERAMSALLSNKGKRASNPPTGVVTSYNMTSLQLTKRMPRPSRRVRRATEADVDELVTFYAAQQKKRLFGYVVDEDWLRARIAAWCDFELDSFYLLEDSDGRIVGCTAPWNMGPIRRSRVLGYHGKMKAIRFGFDALARVAGYTRLPKPGECFDIAYLTFMEVEDDDPALLRDLLLAVYEDYRRSGLHLLSAFVPEGSPIAPAFDGFMVQRVPMSLVGAAGPGIDSFDFGTLRPGFEMALH